MQPPYEGVTERHWWGVGCPLTRPSRHRLRVVGSRVGLDRSTVGTLPGCFDLMGFLYLFLAQISVMKRLLVYSPIYLCPTKQYSPNACGTWSIVNAYVFKIAQPPVFVLLCFLSTLGTFFVLF
jgi:hypothetical protein